MKTEVLESVLSKSKSEIVHIITDPFRVPDGWELSTLGDISLKIIGGGTPSRRNPDYWGSEIPWVTVKDFATFHENGAQEYITHIGLKGSSSNIIPKGNLITSTRMSLGKAVIYNVDVAINQDMKAFILDKNCSSRYLYYWFQSNGKRIEELGSGSTVMGISLTDLRKITIFLPPTKEQAAIATALSDADALIRSLEQLIEKKKKIKQGAMQELLTGKRRLQGFENNLGYKHTGAGLIPEDWAVDELGTIGQFKNGINKSNDDFGFGYPFVNLMDVFGKTRILKSEEFGLINTNIIERKLYNLVKSDVVFIRSSVKPSGVGLTCLIEDDLMNTVFSGFIIRFRDNGNLVHEFKEYCFYNERFRNAIISNSTSSANTNINQEALKKIYLAYPTNKLEQLAISRVLNSMDEELTQLRVKLEKYMQIKQSMMQNLLTGKIRLI